MIALAKRTNFLKYNNMLLGQPNMRKPEDDRRAEGKEQSLAEAGLFTTEKEQKS